MIQINRNKFNIMILISNQNIQITKIKQLCNDLVFYFPVLSKRFNGNGSLFQIKLKKSLSLDKQQKLGIQNLLQCKNKQKRSNSTDLSQIRINESNKLQNLFINKRVQSKQQKNYVNNQISSNIKTIKSQFKIKRVNHNIEYSFEKKRIQHVMFPFLNQRKILLNQNCIICNQENSNIRLACAHTAHSDCFYATKQLLCPTCQSKNMP